MCSLLKFPKPGWQEHFLTHLKELDEIEKETRTSYQKLKDFFYTQKEEKNISPVPEDDSKNYLMNSLVNIEEQTETRLKNCGTRIT
eukprot:UN10351